MTKNKGFTLIELVVVIILLGVLTSVAIPLFLNLRSESREASLQRLAASINTMIEQVRSKARLEGLRPVGQNPGGTEQTDFLVDTNIGSFEVDWRNLCPESRAELGDKLDTLGFLQFNGENSGYQTRVTNQSTWIGYEIPPGQCFVVYDSFACTVSVVSSGC